jgi:hypothetical protein
LAEKFKSKLRGKLKAAAKRNEAEGRSLGYGDRTVGHRGGVSIPKSQRTAFFDQVTGKIKKASKKRAHEVLGSKLKGSAEEAHRGLTGIRHPAQLIPAFKAGSTLTGIIKSLTKK